MIVRVAGATIRVLLSDVTAAEDWELAGSAVEFLGLPELELEDEDEQVPAGDLDLLGDLGMHAMEMGLLLDDVDLYPDEMLSRSRGASASASSSTTRSGSPPPEGLRAPPWDAPMGSRSPRPARRCRPTTCRSAPSSSHRPRS